MQMQQMRREEAERGNHDAGERQQARNPGQRNMPVMMVADASTMPIWNAAEANS